MEERRLDTPTDHPKWYVALEDVPTKSLSILHQEKTPRHLPLVGLGLFLFAMGG